MEKVRFGLIGMGTWGNVHAETYSTYHRASLAAVPGTQNPSGLAAMALVEFEFHHFREALALARQAHDIDPRNTAAFATVGDAQLTSEYSEATGPDIAWSSR